MDLMQAFWGAVFGAVIATISFVIATAPKRMAGGDSPDYYGIIEGGANANTAWFFGLALLFLWTAAAWMIPAGPMLMGIPWFLFFFLGIVFSLLFATIVSPEARMRSKKISSEHPNLVKWPNIYMWGVVGLLIVALIIRVTAG